MAGSSKIVQPSPVGDVQGSKMRMACCPGCTCVFPGKLWGSPPTLTFMTSKAKVRGVKGIYKPETHTALPLLIRAPLAQNELVMRSSGVTVLVSRFQSAPHAE